MLPTLQWPSLRVALDQEIAGIGSEISMTIHLPRRPAHFHSLRASRLSKAESQTCIAGRQVATASKSLGHLAAFPRDDGHFRTDGVAVRCHPSESQDKVMASFRLVVKVGDGLVLRDDQ